ncbi:DUF1510 family protein [Pradoshia sp. D12]|nr:DUF1510 family protein [Pradoshia sp. D12]TPF71582.1 DUF1510 family protein [Bacillus sp. D12]
MDKRQDKKVNKVYNILITVVVLLIVVVGATIFLGNNDEPASQKADTNPESNQSATNKEDEADKEEADKEETAMNEDEQASENEDEEGQDQDQNADQDSSESEDAVESEKVEETASDGNVEEAYSDPSWKPVGTEQSGEHVTQYEKGSTDWNEMEQAIAYGAGIDQSNMTLWYLQNGGEPNKAIGTVSPKDGSSTYRVYIEWVDGEGWKPTKVEKLIKNDKAS